MGDRVLTYATSSCYPVALGDLVRLWYNATHMKKPNTNTLTVARRARWRPFLEGYASLIAYNPFVIVSGRLDRHFATDDAEALASDWQAVGADLYSAIHQYDRENPRQAN